MILFTFLTEPSYYVCDMLPLHWAVIIGGASRLADYSLRTYETKGQGGSALIGFACESCGMISYLPGFAPLLPPSPVHATTEVGSGAASAPKPSTAPSVHLPRVKGVNSVTFMSMLQFCISNGNSSYQRYLLACGGIPDPLGWEQFRQLQRALNEVLCDEVTRQTTAAQAVAKAIYEGDGPLVVLVDGTYGCWCARA